MKTTKLNQITNEKIIYYCTKIINLDKNEKEYNDELKLLLNIFLEDNFKWDLSIMDFFDLEMNILHELLKVEIKEENYEICSLLKKVIDLEFKLYNEFINLLPDDDEMKLEYQEEFNYAVKIFNWNGK